MARCVWGMVIGAAVCIGVCAADVVWAGETEMMSEIRLLQIKIAEIEQLKARVGELEKQLADQKRSILAQQGTVNEVKQSLIQAVPGERLIKYAPGEGVELPGGFKIQADATFIAQGTPNANNPVDTNKSRCDASWSSDIFIEKAFDEWGLALIHLEPGQATTLEGELNLYSNVNRDSNDTGSTVPVTELWYEHYLFDRQVVVTGGKLDPANYVDQNEYAFDETTQFLGRIFRNSPAVEWPNDNTFGASMTYAPAWASGFAVSGSYFNANNTWEDIFDKPFITAQITFMPAKAFGYDEGQWNGNYRLYWWYNGLDHVKLVGQDESPADVVKERNTGCGFSFDQMITDRFGVFSRFGWQLPYIALAGTNPNSAPVEVIWTGGFQVSGRYWKRADDVLALAVGQAFPSKEYKDAWLGGVFSGASPEGHFEAYYRCMVTPNLAVSPDLQWIWNPRGISEEYQGYEHNIFVYGVRAQVNF